VNEQCFVTSFSSEISLITVVPDFQALIFNWPLQSNTDVKTNQETLQKSLIFILNSDCMRIKRVKIFVISICLISLPFVNYFFFL